MAVYTFDEVSNRRLAFRFEGDKLVREYERTFKCYTDDPEDDGRVVLNDPHCPTIGDNYQDSRGAVDGGAFCDSIDPVCSEGNPFEWTVTCHYTSEFDKEALDAQDPADVEDGESDPMAAPTVINFSTRMRTRAAEFDYSDPPKEYSNSAGDAFDPPVEEEVYNLVISITKNQPDADPSLMTLYQGACNRDNWMGFTEYQARITSWTTDQQNEQGIRYYQHKYEIEIQLPSWEIHVRDTGRFQIVGGNRISMAVDEKGIVMPGFGDLDGNGAKLAVGADPVYLKFRRYPLRKFSTLNIP